MKITAIQRGALGLLLSFSLIHLAACKSTPTPEPIESPIVRLFNGVSLDGWRMEVEEGGMAGELFSLHNGVLVCRGEPTAVLRTLQEYENYELLLEWRWAPGSEGGNSGLLLHCSTPRARGIWPRSIEAQLKSGSAAGFYLMGEDVALEIGADPERRQGNWIPRFAGSERPIGEWNQMRAVCEGDRITLYLNGELANEASQTSETRGAIALQSEGAEIHFRRVDLRRLGE